MTDDVADDILDSSRDARSFTDSRGGVGIETSAGGLDLRGRNIMEMDGNRFDFKDGRTLNVNVDRWPRRPASAGSLTAEL